MLEILLTALLPVVVGYAVDRWGYNRTLDRAARRLAPSLPNATARELAELAIIEANKAELERLLKKRAAEGPLSTELK